MTNSGISWGHWLVGDVFCIETINGVWAGIQFWPFCNPFNGFTNMFFGGACDRQGSLDPEDPLENQDGQKTCLQTCVNYHRYIPAWHSLLCKGTDSSWPESFLSWVGFERLTPSFWARFLSFNESFNSKLTFTAEDRVSGGPGEGLFTDWPI